MQFAGSYHTAEVAANRMKVSEAFAAASKGLLAWLMPHETINICHPEPLLAKDLRKMCTSVHAVTWFFTEVSVSGSAN
jgi:hypothetical protein